MDACSTCGPSRCSRTCLASRSPLLACYCVLAHPVWAIEPSPHMHVRGLLFVLLLQDHPDIFRQLLSLSMTHGSGGSGGSGAAALPSAEAEEAAGKALHAVGAMARNTASARSAFAEAGGWPAASDRWQLRRASNYDYMYMCWLLLG